MIFIFGWLMAFLMSDLVIPKMAEASTILNRCPDFVWSPLESRIGGDPDTDKLFFLVRKNEKKTLFKKSALWLGAYHFESEKITWISAVSASPQSTLVYWPGLKQISVINFLSDGWWCRSGPVSVTHYQLDESLALKSMIRDSVHSLAMTGQFEKAKVRLIQQDSGLSYVPGKNGTLVSGSSGEAESVSLKKISSDYYPLLNPSGQIHYLKETSGPKGKGLELWAINKKSEMYRYLPQTVLGHRVIDMSPSGLLVAGLDRPKAYGPGSLRIAELQKTEIIESQIPVPDQVRPGEFWIKSLPEKKIIILKPGSDQIAKKWQRLFILNYEKKVHETMYPWSPLTYPGEIWYSSKRNQLFVTVFDIKSGVFSGLKIFRFKDRSWKDVAWQIKKAGLEKGRQ